MNEFERTHLQMGLSGGMCPVHNFLSAKNPHFFQVTVLGQIRLTSTLHFPPLAMMGIRSTGFPKHILQTT